MDLMTRPNALADAFALEPRYMFDAAGAATGAEAAADAAAQDEAAQQADADAAAAEGDAGPKADEDAALAEALALQPGDNAPPREVVIVDPAVADYETLLTDLDPAVEVILLPEAATLDDIATALAGETGIDALHLISHGGIGQIALGGQSIDGDFTAGEEAAWTAIGAALSETGDILLYGCEIGQGGEGTAFLETIASLTGADVAASDDLTGAADKGGDWELETSVGTVTADTPFSETATQDFSGLLFSGIFDFNVTSTLGAYNNNDASIDVNFSQHGYTLLIDGQSRAAYIGAGYDTTDASVDETLLTLSFVGGFVFDPQSILISNFDVGNNTVTIESDKGDSTSVNLAGFGNPGVSTTVNLSSFANDITELRFSSSITSGSK